MSEKVIAVERAANILKLLHKHGEPMGISDISRELDIYKGTVFRILYTLQESHLVTQDEETGKYWLSFRFYTMGMMVGSKIPLIEAMRPYVAELSRQTNESANVSILEKDPVDGYLSVMILKESRHSKVLSYSVDIGSSTPAYVSSLGKCLLAFSNDLDPQLLFKEPLHAYTQHTITDPNVFLEELAAVRKNGYALDREEQEYGLACIGAPIFSRTGEIYAAVSISGNASAVLNDDLEERIRAVKKTADAITTRVMGRI